MTNENVENVKADAKKVMSDIGTKAAYAKADLEADVEKAKATFGNKSDLEKKAAYVKADLSADVKKAKANLGNKVAHVKADAEKTKADASNKLAHEKQIQEGELPHKNAVR